MTSICHSSQARSRAREVVERLRDVLPRQQFAVAIQAAVGKKVLGREDLKAIRKDVTAKCYGGDVTRKMKLLKQQAEGKKKLRAIGNIEVSKDTFVKLLSKS